jgi:hydrogenase-4 component B
MIAVLAALLVLVACGFLALALARREGLAAVIGPAGPVVALGLAGPPAFAVAGGGAPLSIRAQWALPLAELHLELDPLSAVFLLLILGVGAASAVYGVGYLRGRRGPLARGAAWLFLNLLLASMGVLVLARHAVLFLLAWETMALVSFLLVAFDHDRREVRSAAWTYLVAAHLGSLLLLPMFFLLARAGGSLDFTSFGRGLSPSAAAACFALAVVGFGTKAGLVPFHVWLPEAHPAAPAHVSALLSAVMIKVGVYGLLRVLPLLGEPPLWWGFTLLALGMASAILGVLFALAQRDLKRMLAYSSIENIGLVTIALGIGWMGRSIGSREVAALGFAAALLHVVNHALFKGVLFLSAGSVVHGAGTADMDRLGGLIRRQPATARAFLAGSLAICGLPPWNGFASELLIMLACLVAAVRMPAEVAVPAAAALALTAAVGALALAGFTRAFGILFLGEPRTEAARTAHEAPLSMKAPMAVLGAACLLAGIAAPALAPRLGPALGGAGVGAEALQAALAPLLPATIAGFALAVVVAAVAFARQQLLRGREVRASLTWDCGYAEPSSRMQYTASSFSQPIVDLCVSLLRTRKKLAPPDIHFPERAHLETETPDIGREGIYEPLFEGAERTLHRIRILQHGRLQAYVLGVVLTLVVLLLWHVR